MTIEEITPEYLHSQGIPTDKLIFSKNHLPYNPHLKEFSRRLRQGYIRSEALLWKQLRARQMGYQFNRQKPILNYIADFYCKELSLVVEIDGSSHFTPEAQAYAAERDRQMRAIGLTVVRVRHSDVCDNPEWVAKSIIQSIG